MKRLVVVVAGLVVVLSIHSDANAWFGSKKKPASDGQQAPQANVTATQSAPTASVAAQPSVPVEAAKALPQTAVSKDDKDKQAAITAKKQLEERKRKELANSEWQVELSPLSGKGKKEAETILFRDNQVSFVSYGKKGFPATNFTLSVQEDGSVVWETMQTSEKSGVMFWRGEMPDMQTMRGIFSYHPDAKTTIDYSFTSTGKRGV